MISRRVSARRLCAFTLIELLVVIAIISLLVSILMPSLARAKYLAQEAWCLSNLKNTATSINLYCQQNGDFFPYSGRGWPNMSIIDFAEVCIWPYQGSVSQMHCVTDTDQPGWAGAWWRTYIHRSMNASDHFLNPLPPEIPADANYSYYWYIKMYVQPDIMSGMRGWKIEEIVYPSALIIYTCFSSGHAVGGSGNMGAFTDGHAEWVLFANLNPGDLNNYNLDWTHFGAMGRDVK